MLTSEPDDDHRQRLSRVRRGRSPARAATGTYTLHEPTIGKNPMMNETIASTPASGTLKRQVHHEDDQRLDRLRQERRVDRAVEHAAHVRSRAPPTARRTAAGCGPRMYVHDLVGVDHDVEGREEKDRRRDGQAASAPLEDSARDVACRSPTRRRSRTADRPPACWRLEKGQLAAATHRSWSRSRPDASLTYVARRRFPRSCTR